MGRKRIDSIVFSFGDSVDTIIEDAEPFRRRIESRSKIFLRNRKVLKLFLLIIESPSLKRGRLFIFLSISKIMYDFLKLFVRNKMI